MKKKKKKKNAHHFFAFASPLLTGRLEYFKFIIEETNFRNEKRGKKKTIATTATAKIKLMTSLGLWRVMLFPVILDQHSGSINTNFKVNQIFHHL